MTVDQFGLTNRDNESIHRVLSNYPEILLVRIFGSRAKGDFKAGSDIDLAIMNPGVDELSVSRIKEDFAECSLPYRVDLVDYTKLNHKEFTDHIDRVGVLYYSR